MINESPTMSAGTGGFSGSAAATGPVAGFDPVLDFRKKAFKRIKDQPYVSEYRKQKAKSKKTVKEDFKPHMMYDPKTGKGYNAETEKDHLRMKKMGYTHDKPKQVKENYSRLLQYKVTIPEVGETIIYASSPAELRQKMRLLINPRYRGDVDIERVFPGEAAKFYMDKRMKAMRNIPEATEDPGADAAKKAESQQKKQLAQKQVQQKIAAEKKKIALKKQEMQRALQVKIAAMKRGAAGGQGPKSATEEFSATGNLGKIKHCAENGCAGAIKFLNGEEFEVTPDVAKNVMKGYKSLGQRQNQAKFSNACHESPDSFNRVLRFCAPEE